MGRVHVWVKDHSGGVPGIIWETIQRFNQARAGEAAAGIAYYAFFSLFPLLLVLVSAAGFILERQEARRQVIEFVVQALPISRALIEENLQQVLVLRGTGGVIGLVGAVWSASGVFTTLAYNVNRAWSETGGFPLLQRRLTGFLMLGGLVGLLWLSLFTTALIRLLPQLPLLNGFNFFQTPWGNWVPHLIPLIFSWAMFWSLYYWVPTVVVQALAALKSAGVVAIAWEISKLGFTWYVNTGWGRYDVVYGSLGAVVALLFWVYLSAVIALWGAHLCAVLDQRAREGKREENGERMEAGGR